MKKRALIVWGLVSGVLVSVILAMMAGHGLFTRPLSLEQQFKAAGLENSHTPAASDVTPAMRNAILPTMPMEIDTVSALVTAHFSSIKYQYAHRYVRNNRYAIDINREIRSVRAQICEKYALSSYLRKNNYHYDISYFDDYNRLLTRFSMVATDCLDSIQNIRFQS